MIRAREHPLRKPPSSTADLADANDVAMPLVLLQKAPETTDVAFVTFGDCNEMDPREHQHAGQVMTLVVEPPQRRGCTKPRCGERRGRKAGPGQSTQHDHRFMKVDNSRDRALGSVLTDGRR
jgi:hypothetical protein